MERLMSRELRRYRRPDSGRGRASRAPPGFPGLGRELRHGRHGDAEPGVARSLARGASGTGLAPGGRPGAGGEGVQGARSSRRLRGPGSGLIPFLLQLQPTPSPARRGRPSPPRGPSGPGAPGRPRTGRRPDPPGCRPARPSGHSVPPWPPPPRRVSAPLSGTSRVSGSSADRSSEGPSGPPSSVRLRPPGARSALRRLTVPGLPS